MRQFVCNCLRACFLLLILLPSSALAMPAITCHCFTDRSYDPARPAAADPYLLATTQNSFFANVFNTDKKSIVIKKQQGTSSDDLWIAYWVAGKAVGVTPEVLLQSKQRHGLWKDVIVPLQLSPKTLGVRFSTALNARASAATLGEAVLDELFLRHQLLSELELAALRTAGASSQELIIATVIAAKTKQPVRQVYRDVKTGARTWGASLQWADIDVKNMQSVITTLLKL